MKKLLVNFVKVEAAIVVGASLKLKKNDKL